MDDYNNTLCICDSPRHRHTHDTVGRGPLFRLATNFGHKPVFLDSTDWALDLPPTGMVFVDEAGPLPAAFWSDVSNRLQVCAVLPDSAPRPEGWPGYTVRLDAYLPRTAEHEALLARAEKAERLLGLEGRAHHEARDELRARAERAETALAELRAKIVSADETEPCPFCAEHRAAGYQVRTCEDCCGSGRIKKTKQPGSMDACPARGHGLPHVVKHGETACSYCSRVVS